MAHLLKLPDQTEDSIIFYGLHYQYKNGRWNIFHEAEQAARNAAAGSEDACRRLFNFKQLKK